MGYWGDKLKVHDQSQKLPFSPPSYTSLEIESVAKAVEAGWTGTGPLTAEFEESFRQLTGSKYSVGLASCTSALHLSLLALGIGSGDEVVTTAMTFCSTVNTIIHSGAKPVLVDIEPSTKNIDLSKLQNAITPKTRALIIVHYAGLPVNMSEVCEIAKNHGLYVIEDCAHAVASYHNNKHCGTFGDVGCFSFYATKNIAIGEGGMVVTDNEELAKKISLLRLHGMSRDALKRFEHSKNKTYDVEAIGYKANLTDLQSSIGLIQLKRLSSMQKYREKVWDVYHDILSALDLELPMRHLSNQDTHSLHLYTVGLPERVSRDALLAKASSDHGVTFGVHYNAIPLFSIYKKLNIGQDLHSYSTALEWGSKTISLSLSAAVTLEQAERIALTLAFLIDK